MIYKGSCKCNRWQVEVQLDTPLENLNPRICDCSYCQANPSQIISDPSMSVAFDGIGYSIHQNGDRLAHFFYCDGCHELLAVGCETHGKLRGAINPKLLHDFHLLDEPVYIQPRLLNANEKLERWNKLWGTLHGL